MFTVMSHLQIVYYAYSRLKPRPSRGAAPSKTSVLLAEATQPWPFVVIVAFAVCAEAASLGPQGELHRAKRQFSWEQYPIKGCGSFRRQPKHNIYGRSKRLIHKEDRNMIWD
ncbi:uncharacterized protein LOC125045578 [Penaeus chinensis]|uniref:uncharacterized protein LOC125045578 n=1 Tax=Penaeus chinensis TaxID=139456 RepID=UPI001FB74592|nr:uncharacterized protein LOC125045578 [Penaeus chinensis]